MRFALSIVLLIRLTGCGPLVSPMLPRLKPDEQRQVDEVWNNLLTPVQRVDRQTLLDTNVAFWLYTLGVDKMHMTSEKYFSGGTAVMEIDCERANPDSDQYTVTVLDLLGRTVRRERYTRSEVEESSRMMGGLPNGRPSDLRSVNIETDGKTHIGKPATGPSSHPSTQPATNESDTEDQRFRLESSRRQAAVAAATQPARVIPNKNP